MRALRWAMHLLPPTCEVARVPATVPARLLESGAAERFVVLPGEASGPGGTITGCAMTSSQGQQRPDPRDLTGFRSGRAKRPCTVR